MKRKSILLIMLLMCTMLSTAHETDVVSSGKTDGKLYISDTSRQRIVPNEPLYREVHITDPDEIRAYCEENEMEYDPNVIEIHEFYAVNRNTVQSVQGTAREVGRKEYYLKNVKHDVHIDKRAPMYSFDWPAGDIYFHKSFSLSSESSEIVASCGLRAEFFSAELGASLSSGETVEAGWDGTYRYPTTMNVYPKYNRYWGDVWEKDPLHDDYYGYFEVWEPVGCAVSVTRQ